MPEQIKLINEKAPSNSMPRSQRYLKRGSEFIDDLKNQISTTNKVAINTLPLVDEIAENLMEKAIEQLNRKLLKSAVGASSCMFINGQQDEGSIISELPKEVILEIAKKLFIQRSDISLTWDI